MVWPFFRRVTNFTEIQIMRRLFFAAGAIVISCFSLTAQVPDAVHGNLLSPTKVFFDKTCSRALTVGLADIVLWDVATGTPVTRIDIANNVRDYNPFSTTLALNACAAPDLGRVLIELYQGDQKLGFIFDTRTGKLSDDDPYFNDKALGFDTNGDYIVFRNLRTNNGPPGARLETGLAGTKTTLGLLSDFKPTLASQNGEIVYGEDLKSDKLVIYDFVKGNVIKTKIRFADNATHYYYLMHPRIYSSQWTRVPGKSWWTFYNISTAEILEEIPGLKGPYGFSDQGRYALYYRETALPWQFVMKDVKTGEELTAPWTSGYTAYLFDSRMVEDGSFRLHQLEGDPSKNLGRIVTYDLRNGAEIQAFSIMAAPELVEINRTLRTQAAGGQQARADSYAQPRQEASGTGTLESSGKKIVHDYETFEGLIINYDDLPLPWQLDYDNIRGRDVSQYSYKDKISYGNLSGSSLHAIGKVFAAEGNIGLISVYRRVQGSLDLSWFKISVFDNHGNHLQTENIGSTQKDASGVPFRVDFSVRDAGDFVVIDVVQKSMNQTERKTMTIDKYHGTIR